MAVWSKEVDGFFLKLVRGLFPGATDPESAQLGIEEKRVRCQLRQMATGWAFLLAIASVGYYLFRILGDPPDTMYPLILAFGLGIVASLWVVAKHEFDLGDPAVRALDLIWKMVRFTEMEVWGLDDSDSDGNDEERVAQSLRFSNSAVLLNNHPHAHAK